MGLVFVAEQQRPLRRKVALKVIKPGMDTRAVVARFEAERQALALDEALTRLAVEDPEAAAVVQLRYFAGLSVEEAGQSLGLSRATAYRHWTFARAWLLQALAGDPPA